MDSKWAWAVSAAAWLWSSRVIWWARAFLISMGFGGCSEVCGPESSSG